MRNLYLLKMNLGHKGVYVCVYAYNKIFKKNFRFRSKLNGKIQASSLYLQLPHIHSPPIILLYIYSIRVVHLFQLMNLHRHIMTTQSP